ncbi:hypothetical protein, partial [Eisenbergiella massiliensis]|uniref:hypothetical protein n=2 Tax=Eisenbergiella massiliensis TaxID=1720294 RepID=UPI001A9A498D
MKKTAITIKTRREAGSFWKEENIRFRVTGCICICRVIFYIYRIQDWKATHSIHPGYFLHLSNSGLESNAFNPSRLFFTSIEFRIECVEVFAVEF